ncbi:Hypothetical protein ACI5QO_01089 [Enterococcus faecalis]
MRDCLCRFDSCHVNQGSTPVTSISPFKMCLPAETGKGASNLVLLKENKSFNVVLFTYYRLNFRWGVANIRRKLTIYSGFILLESLVSFSIVCVVAGIFSLTITQLIQQNYQREQELTRTRLGYEAILFLEQTGDLRFKERIYQGETYRFSLMENEGRRILKVTDSRGAILIGQ